MAVKVLALATNPIEAASFRYRILAYVPFLEKSGFMVETHSFFPSESLGAIYSSRGFEKKIFYALKGAIERSALLRRGRYDVILVHRELFPLGLGVFLRRLRRLNARIVYDFDDAIFLPQRQDRWLLRKVENPGGAREIISLSDAVVAGNSYLADFARRYNNTVVVIPTAIDTERFRPIESDERTTTQGTIGWIGSHTTVKYLRSLKGALERLAKLSSFEVKVVGAPFAFALNGVPVRQQRWDLDREVEDFQSCDVGVYPLWDDAWARGKCGFKAIQFMAVGVPVVASSVGVNTEIIQEGVNGFVAKTEDEWVEKLYLLLNDPKLRKRIGMAGRKTVEEKYSLQVNAPKVINVITRMVSSRFLDR